MRMRKFIYQPVKPFRLLNCGQVFTQQIFNKRYFKHFLIIHFLFNNRHLGYTS